MTKAAAELDPVEDVISELAAGKAIVLVDDADRENEGDLVVAASAISAENLQFMIREGKGLICLSLPQERVAALGIPMQVTENTSLLTTNFTVSIDHVSVRHEGVTARGRATTIRESINPEAAPDDFVRPGFVFPLSAVPGGVLRRRGQTEGSVDLARLAGLEPAAAICEIMGADGTMLQGGRLWDYCKRHQLKVTSVEALVQYRLRHELSIRQVAESAIPDAEARFGAPMRVVAYVDDADGEEHLAFVVGEPSNGALVRVHSECLTGDVFGSDRCDCGYQFEGALAAMSAEGAGVLLYLQQEGRGIGLGNKLRAYALQDEGKDTLEANTQLGLPIDKRDFGVAARMLTDLGISEIRLLTNNPRKVSELENGGLKVVERVPSEPVYTTHNAAYLKAKRDKLGHLLP